MQLYQCLLVSMFIARKNLDPKWHFFQEKLLHIVTYQFYKNRAGVKIGVTANIHDGIIFSALSFFPLAFVLCFDAIPEWGREAKEISRFVQFAYETEAPLSLKLIPYGGPGMNELFVQK
jgi:hypothetical protein